MKSNKEAEQMPNDLRKYMKNCFICDENGSIKNIINGKGEDGRKYIFEECKDYIQANRINSGYGDPYFDGEFVSYETKQKLIEAIDTPSSETDETVGFSPYNLR